MHHSVQSLCGQAPALGELQLIEVGCGHVELLVVNGGPLKLLFFLIGTQEQARSVLRTFMLASVASEPTTSKKYENHLRVVFIWESALGR